MLETITAQAKAAAEQLLAAAKLSTGDIVVVGCSTSEVGGHAIGTDSVLEVAEAVFDGLYPVLQRAGVYLAAQCCEHLNRALIVEREAARLPWAGAGQRGAPAQGGRLLCHHGVSPVRPARGRGNG